MQSEIQNYHAKMTFEDEICIYSVNPDLEFIIRKDDILIETGANLIRIVRPSGRITTINCDYIVSMSLRPKREWW